MGPGVPIEVAVSKPKTIHAKDLDWLPDEAGGDDAVTARAEGYQLDVSRKFDDDQKPSKEWLWIVRMTAEISETPEVVDTGTAKSPNGGRIAAREALNRWRRSHPDPETTAAPPKPPEPKPRPKRKPKETE
jgi:hypothetical protein